MSDRAVRRILRGGLWVWVTVSSSAALAQATPAVGATPQSGAATVDGGALKEIVVTARKTTENLQKAPATISVVSAAQLTGSGIVTPTDLNKVLPSASLRSQGPVAQTFIRGVGSALDFPWTSAASAITYDGVIIPRYGTKGVLFDLSSVEQIAGPQGTLYGGSAAGGAINLITNRPGRGYGGDALVEGGNYGDFHGALDQDLRVSDKLSLRTSVDYDRHDPYEAGGFSSTDRIEGRESALIRPTDDVTALVFFSGSQEKGAPTDSLKADVHPLPSDPWNTLDPAFPGGAPINHSYNYQDSQTYVGGANIDWHVGGGTLTYIPGFVYVDDNYSFYISSGILDIHDLENQYSQELRWNQQIGRLKLNLGFFYLHDTTTFLDGISVPALPASQGYYLHVPVIDATHQNNTSYSAFAQGVYSVTDRLRFTLGGRVSEDKITAAGTGGLGPFSFRNSQTTPDWKVGADYDLTRYALVYANIQSSYIPFGYNPDGGNPAQVLPRSKLTAYSAGFKTRLFNSHVEINDEFFYYDYANFQAFSFDMISDRTVSASAKKSVIYGDELTLRWAITPATNFDASIVGQNAKYTNFTGPGFDYSGFRMQNAPILNVVTGLQHRVDLGNYGSLLGRVQAQYNSGYWGNFQHEGAIQNAYSKTDLMLTYAFPESEWKLQGFVNNVGNKATFSGLGPTGPGLPATGFLDAPRTYGLRVLAAWR